MKMKQWAKIGILALACCLAGTSAQAIGLGTAGDYNVFVFGNYSGFNSDVEGGLAAGGNVVLENYSVGNMLPANSGNVLVAGGDLTFTNGQINNGDVVVGGSATLSGVGVPNGVVTAGGPVPVNFSAAQNYLTGLSTSLSQMSATSDLQVFNIDGGAISYDTFSFLDNEPTDATLVFNISGTVVDMGNFGMPNFYESWENVLFNFYEAEALNLYSIGIYGSILAPFADISTGYGNICGTVVANSWMGPMQVNYRPFDDDNPPQVPEPGSALLLGSGVLGLMGAARKKRG